jgi:hypothetical protein
MAQINQEVFAIGNKSTDRDYAWSLVAMSAYSAQSQSAGYLQFYSTGDAAVIFSKSIDYIGFAAGGKDGFGIYCSAPITTSYVASDGALNVVVDLNTSYQTTEWAQSNASAFTEPYSITTTKYHCPAGGGACRNPCPGILRSGRCDDRHR